MEKSISLDAISVLKVDIVNQELLDDTEIEINFNNTVQCDADNHCFCLCSLQVYIPDKENSQQNFHVQVDVKGTFRILDSSIKPDKLHILAVSEVYPHARAIISSIMGTCGLGVFTLPASLPISIQSVTDI